MIYQIMLTVTVAFALQLLHFDLSQGVLRPESSENEQDAALVRE